MADHIDNCPEDFNPQQEDRDHDGIGDVCDDCDCCTCPTLGNVDGSVDCLVTMGDLTVLIDHLFISLTPLLCNQDGNVDLSEDCLVTMGDLTVLIDHLFISLIELPLCPAYDFGTPSAEFTDLSECLNELTKDAPFELGCIDWQYSAGTLNITHVNGGFNCCVDVVSDGIYINGNTIRIYEIDSTVGEGCPCMCCYDVSYTVNNVAPDTYRIVVNEPNLYPADEYLDIVVDLVAEPSGRECVDRHEYPWVQFKD